MTKIMSIMCEKELEKLRQKQKPKKPSICDHVHNPFGPPMLLPSPIIPDEYQCKYCGGKEYWLTCVDPKTTTSRAWLCKNASCAVYNSTWAHKATIPLPHARRALEWPLFCEINGIGNVHHTVVFENLEQSQQKISYLLKFCEKPRGFIVMHGKPGTGKTYCSLAACELFSRKSDEVMFFTQKSLTDKWLQTFKEDGDPLFVGKIEKTSLLVIDDFGCYEPSPGFLNFFRSIIDTRMQWNDRGTIITTNLDKKAMSEFCGSALSDRLRTGQEFVFSDDVSRRIRDPM